VVAVGLEEVQYLRDLAVLVAVVVELSQILNSRADLVSALASFHKHGEYADVCSHILTVLSGLFGFILDERECLLAENAADVVEGHCE
jgi:hypothetical protein